MTPRKSHEGHVPRWLYKSRGRRRKAVVEGPYNCPVCGKCQLSIRIDRAERTVIAKCVCGLLRNIPFRTWSQPVDYLGELIDLFYEK